MSLMQQNFINQLSSQVNVEYVFQINRYEVITSRTSQRYLKLIFHVWNENENFEIDQLYMLYDDNSVHSSFYDFIDQFRQFGEIKDEIYVEDLIGERGTCYFKSNYSHGKTYKKIVLTSWEDASNE